MLPDASIAIKLGPLRVAPVSEVPVDEYEYPVTAPPVLVGVKGVIVELSG